MIAAFIRRFEERYAANDEAGKSRVRMDWGLDCVGLRAPPADSAFDHLALHADRWAAEPAGFFARPDDWEFRHADGTLTFPTPRPTGFPENDTARAEVYDAGPAAPAVIVLPQWHGTPTGYAPLGRFLRSLGITAVLVWLPWHGPRRPAECVGAEYLVSANVGRTLQSFRQAVVEARLTALWLHRRGARRVGVIGNSSGACVGFLAGGYEPLIDAASLNLVTGDFARVVWEGISTRPARRNLESGNVTLDQLRRVWAPLSPLGNVLVGKMRRVPTRVSIACWDFTLPTDSTQEFLAAARRRGHPFSVHRYPCGHYTLGKHPFKWLLAWQICRWLADRLKG
jgi:dienelactone hydrolase